MWWLRSSVTDMPKASKDSDSRDLLVGTVYLLQKFYRHGFVEIQLTSHNSRIKAYGSAIFHMVTDLWRQGYNPLFWISHIHRVPYQWKVTFHLIRVAYDMRSFVLFSWYIFKVQQCHATYEYFISYLHSFGRLGWSWSGYVAKTVLEPIFLPMPPSAGITVNGHHTSHLCLSF